MQRGFPAPPRRRPGPSWESLRGRPREQLLPSPNWAPAFAGVLEGGLSARQRHEAVRRAVAVGGVILARDLGPAGEGGDRDIALGFGMDFGQFDPLRAVQQQREDFGAPNHRDITARHRQRVVERMRDLCAVLGVEGHVSVLRRTRVGPFTEARAIGLEKVEELSHKAGALEGLLPVETALDDIPALALTTEDAFRLSQGRAVVLLPRQIEALETLLTEGSRTVLARQDETLVAICEMRAGQLNPVRVFNL